MERFDGDNYRGTIPSELVTTVGLVYKIRAIDDYGLVGETQLVGIELNPPEDATAAQTPFRVKLESNAPGREAQIAFSTTRSGPARVRLFDVHGRMVASLLDESALPAGRHSIAISNRMGERASGVYFYRVDTVDGFGSGRWVRLR